MKYFTVQEFMSKELGLGGNELLIFAIIYGFSQDGESEFYGSISYIRNMLSKKDKKTGEIKPLSINGVRNALNSLLEQGYIKRTSESHYQSTVSKSDIAKSDTVKKRRVSKSDTATVSKSDTIGVSKSDTNNNNTNNKTNNKLATQSVAVKKEEDIANKFIDMFKSVNDNHERLFSNKTERAATERMVKKHGENLVEEVIVKWLPYTNAQAFAPTVIKPTGLERDWSKVKFFLQKEKNKIQSRKRLTAVGVE